MDERATWMGAYEHAWRTSVKNGLRTMRLEETPTGHTAVQIPLEEQAKTAAEEAAVLANAYLAGAKRLDPPRELTPAQAFVLSLIPNEGDSFGDAAVHKLVAEELVAIGYVIKPGFRYLVSDAGYFAIARQR